MSSQRQLKVGEAIRHALADVIERGDVPWTNEFVRTGAPMISVTEVRVSPDLQNATAFVIPLGGDRLAETVKGLNAIAGFFRHEIAQKVQLRYAPRVHFEPDESFDYASKIDKLLQDPVVAKDIQKSEIDDGV